MQGSHLGSHWGKSGIHLVRKLVPQRRNHVRVGVHGYRDSAVPKHLHYHRGMGALRQKQAGTDMPQIVESHRAETGFFKQAAELTADGGPVQRRADGCGKYEAGFLPPVASYG